MKSINNLKVGDTAIIKKTFSKEEVLHYNLLSRDSNPIHYDENYAKQTVFKKPIINGMLVSSLFGGLLGSKLPGKDTIYLSQTLSFKKPIYVEEEATAKIEITKIREDKPVISFKTTAYNSENEIAIQGEAVVIIKKAIVL